MNNGKYKKWKKLKIDLRKWNYLLLKNDIKNINDLYFPIIIYINYYKYGIVHNINTNNPNPHNILHFHNQTKKII